jgi:septum formation protein
VSAPVLLASASPRRRELLERAGVVIVVRAVEVDESARVGEAADDYLLRIVAAKLAAARALGEAAGAAAILVADTAVVLDGRILGKPTDDEDARGMVRALAGRRHRVATRYALARGADEASETVSTEVEFRTLDDGQVARYVATGEGRDKAGAYAIQGIGAMLVRRIDGSYTNVVGLPLCEVIEALERLGVR